MRDPQALGEAILACLENPGARANDDVLTPYTEEAAVKQYLRASGYPGISDAAEPTIHVPPREARQRYADYEGA